jgi:REP element-mobilizing transposase RayT
LSKYNPKIHDRKSIRLKGYDYSQAGLYFITICVHNRKHLFGKIENGEMILNEYGTIAQQQWKKLQERFPNFKLDTFQIMPNHMHAIISLSHLTIPVRAGFIPAPNQGQPQGIAPTTIGNIIGAYKSLVANESLKIFKQKWTEADPISIMGKLWQRNYYEHIIRNEQAYHRIAEYIINNPKSWEADKFHKKITI